MKYNCLDFFIWRPRRRHSYNRERTNVVLGVTNYDRCRKVYWLLGEVDNKNIDLSLFYRHCYMIVETRKGFHFYMKYYDTNPLRLIHNAIKNYKFLDKAMLRIALERYRKTGDKSRTFIVLRVSRKYQIPDLQIIYIDRELPEWHRQVARLITFFHGARYEEEGEDN